MKPWMVVLGVFVLFQAGALVHPVIGLLGLVAAVVIGVRRWLSRRQIIWIAGNWMAIPKYIVIFQNMARNAILE